jgi:cysteinyl-tRNA synthetase
MSIKIYNSLTRKKEEFRPIKEGAVSMYVCGPTVYDEPHIGHARSAYIFDVMRRYLEYRKLNVVFVRNVTDVDDKIIEKARSAISHQPSTPMPDLTQPMAGPPKAEVVSLKDMVKEVAEKYLDAYHRDMGLLGIKPPDPGREPKATEYIPRMIKLIRDLIGRGAAYVSDGDVYFDIKKAKDYGKLSNQSPDKMEAGVRVSPGEKKRDPLDFALWKTAKEDEPSWDSPWGKGRPGWHIECSVMSSELLGNEFDIHGGGIDLIFPHHENEIAQSEGAGKKFANVWVHHGLLTIKSEKMAKSLGNFITIGDFINRHKDPDYLKLLFLNTHYRHPVDYTEEKVAEMKKEKERILILINAIDRKLSARLNDTVGQAISHQPSAKKNKEVEKIKERFMEAMDDDFNMPQALAVIFELVTAANKKIDDADFISAARDVLFETAGIFGLVLKGDTGLPEKLKALIDKRDEARKNGNYVEADKIRKELEAKGIILEDTKEGTTWRQKV